MKVAYGHTQADPISYLAYRISQSSVFHSRVTLQGLQSSYLEVKNRKNLVC